LEIVPRNSCLHHKHLGRENQGARVPQAGLDYEDGKADVFVLFVVEGYGCASCSMTFLSTFLSSNGHKNPIKIQVGERGRREVDSLYVLEKEIIVPSRIYAE